MGYYETSFALVFCLTRKKILFPRVHIRNISMPGRDLFQRAVKWENFTNIQNELPKLEERWFSFVVFERIRAWYSHFMLGGSSTSIRDSKKI